MISYNIIVVSHSSPLSLSYRMNQHAHGRSPLKPFSLTLSNLSSMIERFEAWAASRLPQGRNGTKLPLRRTVSTPVRWWAQPWKQRQPLGKTELELSRASVDGMQAPRRRQPFSLARTQREPRTGHRTQRDPRTGHQRPAQDLHHRHPRPRRPSACWPSR